MNYVLALAFLAAAALADCSAKRPYGGLVAGVAADLPYAMDFLQPFLTPQQIYVVRTRHELPDNLALQSLPASALESLPELLINEGVTNATVQRYSGSVYNHRMFWASVTNETCALRTGPSGPLLTDINAVWGSIDLFLGEFSRQASATRGSGWTWLCFANQDSRLRVVTTRGHVNPLSLSPFPNRCTPLLGFPHWEHFYYLQYTFDKLNFLSAFWRSVDWQVVSEWYRLYGQYAQAVPL